MSVDAIPRTIVLEKEDRSTASLPLGSMAAWLAGWSAFVVVMAGVVSTQKGVPFRYSFVSEAANYYTLAVASVVVWFVSARSSASRAASASACCRASCSRARRAD